MATRLALYNLVNITPTHVAKKAYFLCPLVFVLGVRCHASVAQFLHVRFQTATSPLPQLHVLEFLCSNSGFKILTFSLTALVIADFPYPTTAKTFSLFAHKMTKNAYHRDERD